MGPRQQQGPNRNHQDGNGSSLVRGVDAGGLSPNTWERLERLSDAWEQAKQGLESEGPQAPEPEIAVVANPTRRSRTPLAPEEVDAIRTARSNGESAMSIARRFEASRMTVWEKTRGTAPLMLWTLSWLPVKAREGAPTDQGASDTDDMCESRTLTRSTCQIEDERAP